MVGLLPLEENIGVRLPAPQPVKRRKRLKEKTQKFEETAREKGSFTGSARKARRCCQQHGY